MIQALYQALQISVSWERVSEIQSIKEALYVMFSTDLKPWQHVAYTTRIMLLCVQA